MTICFQCKAPDHEIMRPGDESIHFVVPEIKYLGRGEEFKPILRVKGWTPKVFMGRQAMYRFMCRNCLNTNQLRDRIWEELREDARKLEKSPNPDHDFYAVLCEA